MLDSPMPELPEVEIVSRNLNEILKPPFQIQEWIFFRKDLRFPIPQKKLQSLLKNKIQKIYRRAKYILLETEDDVLITHLGMTGAWRVESKNWERRRHDHIAFRFNENQFLVYEDARRFGFVEVCAKKNMTGRFQSVGPEPLAEEFDAAAVTAALKKLSAPIKNALMNQKFVVGIGNIYASEILFRSRVSPLKKCSKISAATYTLIWENARSTLRNAIEGGGSTIDNYKNGYGQAGNFQSQHQVYGRAGEKCVVCESPIKSRTLGGRNTFWCGTCQR